jgi:phosphatidylethanolamine/phosphatidyl-N-methylethanolamine N-methyltransferase
LRNTKPMRERASKPISRIEGRLSDEARFFRSWFDNPKQIGAVMPSGPALAEMMARGIDPLLPGPIVELGPGTGVVTRALLNRGVEPGRLILVEFDPTFCALLGARFPGVRIVRGDAYQLAATLREHLDAPPAAIVSSLPLLMKPEPMRAALLEEAFGLMVPGGIFVQFTYGLTSPVPRNRAFAAEASPRIWRNFPPARVWIYRRAGSAGAAVVRPTGLFDRLRTGVAKIRRDRGAELE